MTKWYWNEIVGVNELYHNDCKIKSGEIETLKFNFKWQINEYWYIRKLGLNCEQRKILCVINW